MPKMEIMGK